MKGNKELYWRKTIGITILVMIVWAVFGYLPGILFVDQLNSFRIGGAPVGFWFAQNGSIYVFWLLTFYYARRMSQLDEEFDLHE